MDKVFFVEFRHFLMTPPALPPPGVAVLSLGKRLINWGGLGEAVGWGSRSRREEAEIS